MSHFKSPTGDVVVVGIVLLVVNILHHAVFVVGLPALAHSPLFSPCSWSWHCPGWQNVMRHWLPRVPPWHPLPHCRFRHRKKSTKWYVRPTKMHDSSKESHYFGMIWEFSGEMFLFGSIQKQREAIQSRKERCIGAFKRIHDSAHEHKLLHIPTISSTPDLEQYGVLYYFSISRNLTPSE